MSQFHTVEHFSDIELGGTRSAQRAQMQTSVLVRVGDVVYEGYTTDISKSGLFVVLPEVVDQEFVWLQFALPGSDRVHRLGGRVRRHQLEGMREIPGEGMTLTQPGYGIEFTEVSPQFAAEISWLV